MIQVGTPDEIYRRPATKFVAEFMGEANVLRVECRQELPPGDMLSPDLGQPLACPLDQSCYDKAYLLVRPEFLRLLGPSDQADNELTGTLANEYALGSRVQYHVAVGENVLTVETLAREEGRPQLDSDVRVGWNRQDGWLIAE